MKKRLLPLLLALLLLALTGCEDLDSIDPLDELSQFYRQENEEPEPEPLTAFTLPYVSGETLDPLTTTDTVQQTVGQLLYEGLFALNEQFEPEPVLADAYTYDSESRTWTITLRSGVMFSDGSMLTAQDVAASLARAKSSPRYGARLRCVNSVTAWDGAVVITVSRGSNVDEAALLEALESGKLRAAGLDVWMDEKHPNWALASHPAVSCTPHIGAGTKEAQKRIGAELVDIVEHFSF